MSESENLGRIADALDGILVEIRMLRALLAGTPVIARKLDIERNAKGRCKSCDGSGVINGGGGDYCDCEMGRDLRRVETRHAVAVVLSGTADDE